VVFGVVLLGVVLAALPTLPSPNLKRDHNFRMTLAASRTVVKIAQVEKFLAAG
jgi:hypothetical protein